VGVGKSTFIGYCDRKNFYRLGMEVEADLERYYTEMETQQTAVGHELQEKFSVRFYEYAEKYDTNKGKITIISQPD
jgi:hypothetical protein